MTRGEKIHHMLSQHHANVALIHKMAMDGETPGTLSHKFHKAMCEEHESQKNQHLEQMEECSKAAPTGNLEKRDALRPTDVTRVIPNAPGYVMVPRNGAPVAPAKPAVDSAFTKLFAIPEIDDDNLLSQ